VKARILLGIVGVAVLCGCGGGGGSSSGGLQVSSVAGAYHGTYSSSNGTSGTVTVTIGPTGAVNMDFATSNGLETGTVAGTLVNGGGFSGTSNLTYQNAMSTYTDRGSFQEQSGGGLTAAIQSVLVSGTVGGTTTDMTLSFG